MGTEMLSESAEAVQALGAVADAAKPSDGESPVRKQVTLEEVQTLLERAVPAMVKSMTEAAEVIDEVLSFATTRRFPGNEGMEIRLQAWRQEGWPNIINDLNLMVTEFQSWQSYIAKENEIRALRKDLAAAEKQVKAGAKAANAEAVTGEKPAAKTPAKKAEAKPATKQRRSRKSEPAEEPAAA